MSELILAYRTGEDLANAVAEAEDAFNAQIARVAEELSADSETRILSMAGPTCSGKTTAAARLSEKLQALGRRAVALSIDDFYLDRSVIDAMGDEPDYESFSAIDSAYLSECVGRLLGGQRAMIPRYSFAEGGRAGYSECVPQSGDIYIFEGIQALYPQVMELFGHSAKSLFISVADDAVINGVFFDKTELRLVRRLLRDFNNRATSADETLTLWKSVRKNEEANILPYAGGCDFTVSSYLAYETPVIARALVGILAQVPEESANYPLANHLAAKLSLLLPVSADTDIVPEGSILREFTGRA